ncbi:MAG: GNAT family N-acetyltransferase [Acidimicrobiales bacterium]
MTNISSQPGPSPRASVGEVAWIVGEPHQGKGYASEAAEVLVRWLAGESVRRVQAHILAGHAASEGVARRAGLHDTGTEANGENLWPSTHDDTVWRALGLPCSFGLVMTNLVQMCFAWARPGGTRCRWMFRSRALGADAR